MEKLQNLLQQEHPSYNPSWVQLLEDLRPIDLTEDEIAEALVKAKLRKAEKIKETTRFRREEENRRAYTQEGWTFEQIDSFMHSRANELSMAGKLTQPFQFEDQVKPYYLWLCFYFVKDPRFIEMSQKMGVENPSFTKGIYLGGNVGVGKTTLMKLFQRNRRQVYTVQNAKSVADLFESQGQESLDQFVDCPSIPENDVSNFYHRLMGLCIDDIGTESIKIHFGNKKNVIGDLIEKRYAKGNTGPLLHLTTNLTGDQLRSFYGERVASRIRECMNVVDYMGEDRRK